MIDIGINLLIAIALIGFYCVIIAGIWKGSFAQEEEEEIIDGYTDKEIEKWLQKD